MPPWEVISNEPIYLGFRIHGEHLDSRFTNYIVVQLFCHATIMLCNLRLVNNTPELGCHGQLLTAITQNPTILYGLFANLLSVGSPTCGSTSLRLQTLLPRRVAVELRADHIGIVPTIAAVVSPVRKPTAILPAGIGAKNCWGSPPTLKPCSSSSVMSAIVTREASAFVSAIMPPARIRLAFSLNSSSTFGSPSCRDPLKHAFGAYVFVNLRPSDSRTVADDLEPCTLFGSSLREPP